MNPENYSIPRRHSLLGQTTKLPLSNFEPQKTSKYMELWGLRSTLITYKKKCIRFPQYTKMSGSENLSKEDIDIMILYILWYNTLW